MTMNRRQFITSGLATAMGASSLGLTDALLNQAQAAVAPTDYKSMVCVYLNGGADTFNVLIPYSNAEYNAYNTARGEIAFDRNSLLSLSSDFAVNPLLPGVQGLFSDSNLSFLANVGNLIQPTTKQDIANGAPLPASLGAHNTQTNYWQADHRNDSSTTKDGWGGRVAHEFINNSVMPINFPVITGYNLFQSHAIEQFYKLNSTGLINHHDQDKSSGFGSAARTARRNAMYEINQLSQNDNNHFMQHAGHMLEEGLALNLDAQNAINDVTLNVDFGSASSFETAAKLIAIRESLGLRRQIFYIQINGFDSHSNQDELFALRMAALDEGLTAFDAAMHELNVHDSVVTFTASEFGRTLATNNAGTDHAWGGNHIIMGGPVEGGEIHGQYPDLVIGGNDDFTNNAGRMIPTTSTSQYSAALANWFGVPSSRLEEVFPNLANFSGQPDLGIFS